MEIFTQQLLNGIVLGSVYAMVAVGYTMVYGILQLINFAHGEVLMVGAMLGLSFVTFVTLLYPSLPAFFILVGAISIAAVACPILSATIERKSNENGYLQITASKTSKTLQIECRFSITRYELHVFGAAQ